MKLVHDADNLVPIRINDVPDMLRKFADQVENGYYGDVVTVYALIDTPENLHTEVFGEALSRYEALGMLELAKCAALDAD